MAFPKINGEAFLNEKGKIVLLDKAREALELKPGDKVMVMKMPGCQALMMFKIENSVGAKDKKGTNEPREKRDRRT